MSTFLWLFGSVIVGIIVAWLAGQFLRGNGLGLAGDTLAGVLGAILGGLVFHLAGLDLGGELIARLFVASVGAAVVLILVHRFTGRRKGHHIWS